MAAGAGVVGTDEYVQRISRRIAHVSERTGVDADDNLIRMWNYDSKWEAPTETKELKAMRDRVPGLLVDQMNRAGFPGQNILDLIGAEPKNSCGIAGSSVLKACLEARGEDVAWMPSDFDIFFAQSDEAVVSEFCRELARMGLVEDATELGENYGEVWRTGRPWAIESVQNFRATDPQSTRKIQVIRKSLVRCYGKSMKGLVSCFDIDPVKMFVAGNNLRISSRALAAIENRTLGLPTKLRIDESDFRKLAGRIEKYVARGFVGEPRLIVIVNDATSTPKTPDEDAFKQLGIAPDSPITGMYEPEIREITGPAGPAPIPHHIELLRRPGRAVKGAAKS